MYITSSTDNLRSSLLDTAGESDSSNGNIILWPSPFPASGRDRTVLRVWQPGSLWIKVPQIAHGVHHTHFQRIWSQFTGGPFAT